MKLVKCVLVRCPWTSNSYSNMHLGHNLGVTITTVDSMSYQTTHYIPSKYVYEHSKNSYVIIPRWFADKHNIDWIKSNYTYNEETGNFLTKSDIRDIKIDKILNEL